MEKRITKRREAGPKETDLYLKKKSPLIGDTCLPKLCIETHFKTFLMLY
jgi:hypothetical protein